MQTDVASWVPLSGLKEVRDQREAQVLCRIMLDLTHKRPERAADVICMRLRELRFAKMQGNTWEKAEAISLLPGATPSSAPVPETAMALH